MAFTSILFGFAIIIPGILIGGVGIGGVLLVPMLKYIGDIPLHVAIPACMFAYIATGAIGTLIYARHGSIEWSLVVKVCIGALPGAYLGAAVLQWINPLFLEAGIAALLIVSGLNALSPGKQPVTSDVVNDNGLLFIGFITGVGSALSGTGGPLVLIPVLMWRSFPVLTAIGLSQVVQIPIALAATTGNMVHGLFDFKLALFITAFIAVGAVIGAKVVHKVKTPRLKKAVAVFMVAVGISIVARLVVI